MANSLDGSVQGAATVEFRRSLLHSIVLDLSYVSLAEEYEGFDQWVYSTRASMSADLREEIETVFNPFANTLLLHLLHTRRFPKPTPCLRRSDGSRRSARRRWRRRTSVCYTSLPHTREGTPGCAM